MSWVAWEPLFLKNNIEIKYFPLILSAAFLFSSFAAYVSKKIVLYFTDERKYLVVTMFLMSLSHVLVFVLFGPIAAITFFILKNGFFSFQNPIKQDMLHRLIPSRIRATIGSVDSMYDALAVVIATVGGGLLLDTVGVYYTLLITGLIMLPAVYFSSLLVIRQQTEIL